MPDDSTRFDERRPRLSVSHQRTAHAQLRWWCEPSLVGTQDAVVVVLLDDGVLRVAAVDGCTPHRSTPSVAGVDGATYAATLIAAALATDDRPDRILERVNAHLVGLGATLSPRVRPQACVAVADLTPCPGGFTVDAWAAGDAELWVRAAGEWSRAAGGPSTDAPTQQRWLDRRATLRAAGASRDELRDAEAEFFADRALYVHHTPIGRFADPGIDHLRTVAEQVIVSTDGARLTAAACADVDAHLATLRTHEAALDLDKRHDDCTVVLVRPATD